MRLLPYAGRYRPRHVVKNPVEKVLLSSLPSRAVSSALFCQERRSIEQFNGGHVVTCDDSLHESPEWVTLDVTSLQSLSSFCSLNQQAHLALRQCLFLAHRIIVRCGFCRHRDIADTDPGTPIKPKSMSTHSDAAAATSGFWPPLKPEWCATRSPDRKKTPSPCC
jgi:hypothetical protein